MPWTFYTATGQQLKSTVTNISNLDIDGATAIGEAVAGADLFIMDNGAGGTNVKVTATEVATFIGVPAQAVQSDIEAQTNQNTYIPPDLMKYHPGVAKAWCKWEQSGDHSITLGYGWTSVTDGGAAGDTDHVVSTAFSSTNWLAVSMAGANHMRVSNIVSTTAFSTVTNNDSHAGTDGSSNYVVMFGDQ